MSNILIILSLLGLIISVYALYVETRIKRNASYKPMCDLGNNVSCTRNFRSSDANVFFLKNSVLGIGFYILLIVLAYMNFQNYIFYLAIPAFFFNLYLTYASIIRLKNFCLVCIFTYIIVILILTFSYLEI